MEDVLTYTEGSFGARGRGMARDVPQRVLVAAQWGVLVAVGFMVAGPRGRRAPHTVRLPTLAVIPPEQSATADRGASSPGGPPA